MQSIGEAGVSRCMIPPRTPRNFTQRYSRKKRAAPYQQGGYSRRLAKQQERYSNCKRYLRIIENAQRPRIRACGPHIPQVEAQTAGQNPEI